MGLYYQHIWNGIYVVIFFTAGMMGLRDQAVGLRDQAMEQGRKVVADVRDRMTTKNKDEEGGDKEPTEISDGETAM